MIGPQGAVAAFLGTVQGDTPVEIWGDGSGVRDFVYVTEVAGLFARAASSPVCGVFNVGSGQSLSLNELLSAMCRMLERDIAVYYGPPVPSTSPPAIWISPL